FFSSRRRHTRFSRDWSSDVCSSDLDASCRRGEPVLFFAFEENGPQLIRNMKAIGLPLEKWIKKELLHIEGSRPALFGLESHLVRSEERRVGKECRSGWWRSRDERR